jgi:hypothetical protein
LPIFYGTIKKKSRISRVRRETIETIGGLFGHGAVGVLGHQIPSNLKSADNRKPRRDCRENN